MKVKVSKKAQERAEAIEQLKRILQPGDTVRGIVRKVSKSGMSRKIDFYGPNYTYLTGYMAEALDLRRTDNGLHIVGCGMDMIFATVYNLGSVLWPTGTKTPHGTRNGQPDNCGGYALNSARL